MQELKEILAELQCHLDASRLTSLPNPTGSVNNTAQVLSAVTSY